MFTLKKFLPYILIAIGLSAISLAFITDLVGVGGQGGFGTKQMLLVLAGSLIFLFGLSLVVPAGRRVYDRLLHPTEADQVEVSMKSIREKLVVIILMAAWFGMVTGYAEAIFRFIRKFIFGDIIEMSQQFVWMIPVADLVLFCFVGLVVFLVTLAWKKAATIGIITFIFSFLMVLSLYYVKPRIAWYAALLLAGGIALQLARFLSKRQGGFYKLARTSLPWMAVIVGMIAVITILLV